MPLEEPEQSNTDAKRRRVSFWFMCSALTGVCAREVFNNTPEQIIDLTFRVAEGMTERWMKEYGTEPDNQNSA